MFDTLGTKEHCPPALKEAWVAEPRQLFPVVFMQGRLVSENKVLDAELAELPEPTSEELEQEEEVVKAKAMGTPAKN